jgi:dTDP-4-dehydrorhamnose reductase
LDLREHLTLDFKKKYTRAVICIPGGGFRTFDTQNYARSVNDSQKLISGLIHNGVPVTFLSTSAVFSGQSLRPTENQKLDPTNLYGRFKADTESILIESSAALNSNFQIIRLTKIFSVFLKPVEEWITNWGSGEFVTTFRDLRISPISLDYCIESLLKIITGHSSGIFHLSGKEDFSYFELSLLLSSSLGFSEKLNTPSSYLNFASKIDYTPMYAQLGMEGTTKSFPHIHPQEIQDFISDINLEFFGN